MKIRKATTADIAPLEALISESVRGLSAGYYSNDQIESALVNIFGVDTQLIEDRTYYVAEEDGQIVGCGGWSKRETLYGGDQTKAGADPLLNPETDAARIRAFFVHPKWARRGIGREIIEVCERAARRERFKAMELVATMPGEPLYRACGYEVVEKLEVELPEGVKLALARMRKEMAPEDDAREG